MRSVFLMCEMILRFLIIIKRRKFHLLVRRLAKVYSTFASECNMINFKSRLRIILFLDDVMVITITLFGFAKMKTSHLFGYLGDNYHFVFIPAPYSTPVFYMHAFINNLTCLSSTIPIYFCCVCYVLKKMFMEFKNVIQQQRKNVSYLSAVHSEIQKTIVLVNKVFHTILSLTLAISLTWIFYECYNLIFVKMTSSYEIINRSLFLIFYCIKFISICMFASSVTEIAIDVKHIITNYPLDADPWKNLRWILGINENTYSFLIFDKISVDKSLILSAAGALLTYGVIFTSFSSKI